MGLCKVCGNRGWYLSTMGIKTEVVECLDCKYTIPIENRPSLNAPFQEIYDKISILKEKKREIIKEKEFKDKNLLSTVEKIKKLSKKDKDDWLLYNKLKFKFESLGII